MTGALLKALVHKIPKAFPQKKNHPKFPIKLFDKIN
jgi:hypothetical protein